MKDTITNLASKFEWCSNFTKKHVFVCRIEKQKIQKAWLQHQLEQTQAQLTRMLELRNQLDVMLEVTMYHTLTEEAKQLVIYVNCSISVFLSITILLISYCTIIYF